MVREYIVKIADDVTEDDDVLYGKPAKELIRCKDCKYWQTNTQFCTRWSAPFATQHTSPNWYCADAERKDGDGNEAD